MDELRNLVWDHLYQQSEPQSFDDIAAELKNDPQAVRNAVCNDWFEIADGRVGIAYKTQN